MYLSCLIQYVFVFVFVIIACRVPSDVEPIMGSFRARREGTLILTFDNSYSWFNPKLLTYKVALFQVNLYLDAFHILLLFWKGVSYITYICIYSSTHSYYQINTYKYMYIYSLHSMSLTNLEASEVDTFWTESWTKSRSRSSDWLPHKIISSTWRAIFYLSVSIIFSIWVTTVLIFLL